MTSLLCHTGSLQSSRASVIALTNPLTRGEHGESEFGQEVALNGGHVGVPGHRGDVQDLPPVPVKQS